MPVSEELWRLLPNPPLDPALKPPHSALLNSSFKFRTPHSAIRTRDCLVTGKISW